MTIDDALVRTLSSTASAETTRLADFYYAQTGRNLHDDASKIARGVVEELQNMREAEAEDTPPDPYNLDALRAAQATPLSQFEETYKAERRRALANEQVQLDADAEDEIRALAAHRREIAKDLSAYEAPNPYAEVLKLRGAR